MGDGRFPAELLVEFGEFLGESRPFRSVRRASSKLPWATYSCPSDRGPMGEALLRNFGQIAYMANDEAEKNLPTVLGWLLASTEVYHLPVSSGGPSVAKSGILALRHR